MPYQTAVAIVLIIAPFVIFMAVLAYVDLRSKTKANGS